MNILAFTSCSFLEENKNNINDNQKLTLDLMKNFRNLKNYTVSDGITEIKRCGDEIYIRNNSEIFIFKHKNVAYEYYKYNKEEKYYMLTNAESELASYTKNAFKSINELVENNGEITFASDYKLFKNGVTYENKNGEFKASNDDGIIVSIKDIGRTTIDFPDKENIIKKVEEEYSICTIYDQFGVVGYGVNKKNSNPVLVEVGKLGLNKKYSSGIGLKKSIIDGFFVDIEGLYLDENFENRIEFEESAGMYCALYNIKSTVAIDKLYIKYKLFDVENHQHSFIECEDCEEGDKMYIVEECVHCHKRKVVTKID